MRIHRNVQLLAIHNFFHDFRPYSAIAVLYFTQIAGSFAFGMSVFSFIMISAALLEVPTGIFSDYIGRKKTLILGSLASVVALSLYAVGSSLFALFLGAFFEGMSRSFFSGNNDALLHDTLTQEGKEHQYAETLGKTSSMFQIALALGALLASAFATISLQLIVLVSVVPQFCCLLTSFFFVEPNVHTAETTNIFSHVREAFLQFLHNRKLRLLSVGSSIQFGIGEAMFQFEPAFIAALWPTWAVGVARMCNHIFGWLSFWFAGRCIAKFSAHRCLFAAAAITSVAGLTAFGFPSVWSPVILACMSLFFGIFIVSQNTLLQKEFTPNQRATMASLTSLSGSFLFGISAIALGFIADTTTPAFALLVGETSALLLLPMYWRLFRR